MSRPLRSIGKAEISQQIDVDSLIEPSAEAFKTLSSGGSRSNIDVLHPTDYSDIHVKSAILQGADIFTVKLAGWSAKNEALGIPASSGMILVFDASTCRPVAMLQDDHLISDLRTAAAGALAARELSNPDARVASVLGAGEQAYRQLEALFLVREIQEVHIWNRNNDRAHRLLNRLAAEKPNLKIHVEATVQAAVEAADILLCTTASRDPLVKAEWLKPGMHITSVGSDDSTKAELEPACLEKADLVVVDEASAAAQYGNIHRAIAAGKLTLHDVTEIGALLSGNAIGRQQPTDITIASFVGLGVQDLAAARLLRERISF